LRESENKYRLLFENADEAIFIAQQDRIIFSNPALSRLSGFSTEQIMESTLQDLVHPADHNLVSERYRQRIAGLAVPSSYAFRIRTADESFRWVEINSVLYQWKGKPATLNYLRDITARHKIETSMGYLQKMEAVGVMAGGIAHKFNNALTGITAISNCSSTPFRTTLPWPATAKPFSTRCTKCPAWCSSCSLMHVAANTSRLQPLAPLVKEVTLIVPAGSEKRIANRLRLSPAYTDRGSRFRPASHGAARHSQQCR
jgi:PAS domain S-box-containing protein